MNRHQRRAEAGTASASLLADAVRRHQAGQLDEAEKHYRRAIAVGPDNAEAHHRLGVLLAQTGRHALAVECIGKAVALDGGQATAHANLGHALRALGRLEDAVAAYRRALALRPDFATALAALAQTLRALGQIAESMASQGALCALQPDSAEARMVLGGWQMELGRYADAETSFRHVLQRHPVMAEAWFNLAVSLAELQRPAEAVAAYRETLRLRPDLARAHNNLGALLLEQGGAAAAMASVEAALACQPDYPEAYNNLGAALAEAGRVDDAVAAYRAALVQRPAFPQALNNLAVALRKQGAHHAAAEACAQALALRPDYAEAHYHRGLALLSLGEMGEGWAEYEWRWQTPLLRAGQRGFARPLWRGEAAAGQTLLIHAEQGFGDTLQFCRYVPLAAVRGLRVIVEAPGPLVRLLESLDGVAQVVARGADLPPFDRHIPMLSLPLAFGTTLGSVPAHTPYLRADAAQVARWDSALGPALRVGLVWAGNPRRQSAALAAVDRRRSIAPERLAPVFAVPGVQFVSLQKDGPAVPDPAGLFDAMAEMADFADTAALVAALDVVIAVDTAVAHLAGALGKPVWLLDRFDPCWRWLTGRRDSPWYPRLRIYRQPAPGDWDSVLDEVAVDLRDYARGWVRRQTSINCAVSTDV